MNRRYVTADVFTDRMFGGNPVAVLLDAAGLSAAQMQAVAIEFGYSETTFVLPPRDPSHTAWVRIFTPSREVPFAGHPNVGTAFVLAREMAARGEAVPDRFTFEEAAGLVPVDLLREGGATVGAELTAPEPLSRRATVAPDRAAACLSLAAGDVRTDAHPPQVVSVGLPFLVVELASRDALRRAQPDRAAYDSLLPLDGATATYAYTRDIGTGASEAGTDLQARMFTPRMTEDPATGSATAAVTALLAELRGSVDLRLSVGQGVDMGRPSLLLARASRQDGGMIAFVGGRCVLAMEGSLQLPGRMVLGRRNVSSGYPYEDTYGYSRAVRVGNQVFVSGTTARPPHLDGDTYTQGRAALATVAEALAEAGAALRHVVRTVVYVVDMMDAPLVARVHAEIFGSTRPASTLVQVAGLTPSAARIEIEATAIIAD